MDNLKKVYTQGSFDMLHSGHINLLRKCTYIGDIVVVSLLSDACYEAYRGYPPTMPFREREAVIKSLKYVDVVIKGDNLNTENELEEIRPNFVVVGSDWAKKDIYKQYNLTPEWFDDRDIFLVFFPYTEGVSSTRLKQK